jgi:hydrogenase small subunit
MPAVKAVDRYAKRASAILAVGACACYGGMIKGAPNPTGAQGLEPEYYGKPVVKIPGCPSHPRWIVGTVASILASGALPSLDAHGRPLDFFGTKIHERCTLKDSHDSDEFAPGLSEFGCLFHLGCKGKETFADCPELQWNSSGPGEPGVNWCVGSGSPCIGCTEPDFPDGKSPFFTLDPRGGAHGKGE